MANPQKENGHLDLANELLEILIRSNLSGGEFRIILLVLRKTWAWNKKDDWISISQMQKMTGFSRQYVCSIRKELVNNRLLVISENRVKFNKNYEEWLVNNRLLVNNRRLGSQQSLTKGSQQQMTHKRNYTNETNTKEIYSDSTFNQFWDLYDKKVGRPKAEAKWKKLSLEEKQKILDYVPKYKLATPDKKFRKNPETFFNNRSWEDELVGEEKTNNSNAYPTL